MNDIKSLGIFISIFVVSWCLSILFHEAGHYLVLKAFGITPIEFGWGWGDELLRFAYSGTDFVVNSQIFKGGYNTSEILEPITTRWAVLIPLAGPFVNLTILVLALRFAPQFSAVPIALCQFLFLAFSLIPTSTDKGSLTDGALAMEIWEQGGIIVKPDDGDLSIPLLITIPQYNCPIETHADFSRDYLDCSRTAIKEGLDINEYREKCFAAAEYLHCDFVGGDQ